jgi:uncharacterized protein (DUF2267 family)
MEQQTESEISWTGEGTGTRREAFYGKISERLPGIPADEAAEAVIHALCERLSKGLVDRLFASLPDDLRRDLGPYMQNAKAETAHFERDDFYLAVAEMLAVPAEDVRRVLHAVFAALHTQLTDAESERIASQLPDYLSYTWLAARRVAEAPA